MAKCKACGQENPEGARFCSYCGHSLETKDNAAVKEALDAAGQKFDEDSMATLDKSRITYVCTVCGSVNRIDQDRCTRCGKPRPRNEYVNALKRLKKSADIKAETETLVAPLPVSVPEEPQEAPAPQEPETPAVQEPIQEPAPEPAPAEKEDATAVPPVTGGQVGPITQPFIIVPYVNPMQPLRQYNPNQLYRYEPYTQEELNAMQAQREAEELARRMEAEKAAGADANQAPEAPAADAVPAEPVICAPKAKSVRWVSAIMLILSLGLMVFAVVSKFIIGGPTSAELLRGAYRIGDVIANPKWESGWCYSAGAILTLAFALIIFIRSIVRCATGRARYIGGLFPTLMLLAYCAFGLGVLKIGYNAQNNFNSAFNAFKELFKSGDIHFYVECALVVVMFIVCWFCPKNVVLDKKSDKKLEKKEEDKK